MAYAKYAPARSAGALFRMKSKKMFSKHESTIDITNTAPQQAKFETDAKCFKRFVISLQSIISDAETRLRHCIHDLKTEYFRRRNASLAPVSFFEVDHFRQSSALPAPSYY